MGRDPFVLNGGYSMLWLCILFLVGASVKKINLDISPKKSLVFFLIATLITYSSKLVLPPFFLFFGRLTIMEICLFRTLHQRLSLQHFHYSSYASRLQSIRLLRISLNYLRQHH
jgi:hypothetical protein